MSRRILVDSGLPTKIVPPWGSSGTVLETAVGILTADLGLDVHSVRRDRVVERVRPRNWSSRWRGREPSDLSPVLKRA